MAYHKLLEFHWLFGEQHFLQNSDYKYRHNYGLQVFLSLTALEFCETGSNSLKRYQILSNFIKFFEKRHIFKVETGSICFVCF